MKEKDSQALPRGDSGVPAEDLGDIPGGNPGLGESSSLESLEFVVPRVGNWKEGSGGGLEERRKRLGEAFKVGNFIEVIHSQARVGRGGDKCVNYGGGTGEQQRLVTFLISKILGMGAYGIVVLAEVCSPERKKSRNSVTVEIGDFSVKQLLEKLEPRKSGQGLGDSGRRRMFSGARGKRLAIKIMDLEANDYSAELEDPLTTARKEINIMSELQDCEQILKYYITFSSGSFLYILMEYAEGGSLYGLYNRYGGFPEELLSSVIKDVLRALRRLHGQGYAMSQHYILHNDIKSANILLTQSCVAKLADFGVSRKVKLEGERSRDHGASDADFSDKDVGPPISSQEVLGSPFWMAPETILGSAFSGRPGDPGASDIWSLGITTLELAFGRIPWPSFGSLEELLGHILRSPPPQKCVGEDIKGLFSPEFWDFVDLCLSKDPSLRKSASDLLSHPFITLKARRPPRLALFLRALSGVQSPNPTYFWSFFNYMSHFLGRESGLVPSKGHSFSGASFVKNTSKVSISRYFSRKRNSIPKDFPGSKGPIDGSSKPKSSLQCSGGLSVGPSSGSDKEKRQLQPSSLMLDKRVSVGQVHRFLNSPSIELGSFRLKEYLSSEQVRDDYSGAKMPNSAEIARQGASEDRDDGHATDNERTGSPGVPGGVERERLRVKTRRQGFFCCGCKQAS